MNNSNNNPANNNHNNAKPSIPVPSSLLQHFADQILILVTTATKSSFAQTHKKIHYLLNKSNSFDLLYKSYFCQLVHYYFIYIQEGSSRRIDSNTNLDSPIVQLLIAELNFIAFHINLSPSIFTAFYGTLSLNPFETPVEFLSLFAPLEQKHKNYSSVSFFAKFCTALSLVSNNSSESCQAYNHFLKDIPVFLKSSIPDLLLSLDISNWEEKNLSNFLKLFFDCPVLDLPEKLIVANFVCEKLVSKNSSIPKSNILLSQINSLFSKMTSIKSVLEQTNPELISIEYVFQILCVLQDQQYLNESIALVLTEIILPQSQKLSNNSSVSTAITVKHNELDDYTPFPTNTSYFPMYDACAKGEVFRHCSESLKLQPDWEVVYQSILENITHYYDQNIGSIKPNLVSILQFFSSLPSDQAIDSFLVLILQQQESSQFTKSTSFWFPLFYFFHYYNPSQLESQINNEGSRFGMSDTPVSIFHNLNIVFNAQLSDVAQQLVHDSNSLLKFDSVAQICIFVATSLFSPKTPQQIQDMYNADVSGDSTAMMNSHYLFFSAVTHNSSQMLGQTSLYTDSYKIIPRILVSWLNNKSPFLPFAIKRLTSSQNNLVWLLRFIREDLAIDTNSSAAKISSVETMSILMAQLGCIPFLLDHPLPNSTLKDFEALFNLASLSSSYLFDMYNHFKNYLNALPSQKDQIIQFLISKMSTIVKQSQQLSGSNINADAGSKNDQTAPLSLQFIDDVLRIITESEPCYLNNDVKNLLRVSISAYPPLIAYACSNHSQSEGPSAKNPAMLISNSPFPPAVETEMKDYYQRMYNNSLEISEFISILRQLLLVPMFNGAGIDKQSIQRYQYSQYLFSCMVHSMLDEFRFFNEYPLDALRKTSLLYGSLIKFDLVSSYVLQLALSFVLEACAESNNNLFKFAVQVLLSTKERLPEWPKYVEKLSTMDSLQQQPQLAPLLEHIRLVTAESKASYTTPTNNVTSNAAETTEEEEPVVDVPFKSICAEVAFAMQIPQEVSPQKDIQAKILFEVNNVSDDTLTQRAESIKKNLRPSKYDWFATYIVGRAKNELNYQELYSSLVKLLKAPLLEQYVLQCTLKSIYKIFNYGSTDSQNDRTHLKNLGSWLGLITIARDIPVLRDNIAVKELLLEGYLNDQMSFTIPFVSKLLTESTKSKENKIICPPFNPWILAQAELLVEIYQTVNIPMSLKFEIEILLTALGLKMDDIENRGFLKTHTREELREIVNQRNTSKKSLLKALPEIPVQQQPNLMVQQQSMVGGMQRVQDVSGLQQQQLMKLRLQQQQQQFNQQQPQLRQQPSGAQPEINSAAATAIASIDNFANNLTGRSYFALHPNVKRLFVQAFMKIVREVLPPAVDRAVNISVNTAHTLVLKDFALEVDENKLRRTAVLSTRSISQNLARVFARDLIYKNVYETVYQALNLNASNSNSVEQQAIEQTLLGVLNENIDQACSIIELAAMEKATAEMDIALRPSIFARRQHKLENNGQVFISPSVSRWSLSYPQPLGLAAQGVTNEQLSVYEDLARLSMGNQRQRTPQQQQQQLAQQQQQLNQQQVPALDATVQLQQTVQRQQLSGQQISPNVASTSEQRAAFSQSVSYLQSLLEALLKALAETSDMHFNQLQNGHIVKNVLAQILNICSKTKGEEIYVKVAQFTVNALFTSSESVLARETLVFLLNKLCELSPSTAKDAGWWLVHAEDDRKYNSKIMATLLKVGLISPSDLDASIAKAISSRNTTAIKFAAELIEETLLTSEPFCLRTDFVGTIEKLNELQKAGTNDIILQNVLTKLNESSAPINTDNKILLCSQMGYIFVEWIKLLQHNNIDDKLLYVFIYQMFEKGIINKPSYMSTFFRTATEMAIASFLDDGFPYSRSEEADIFVGTDALAKLIIKIIVCQTDDADKKIEYLKQILTIITLVFNKDHSDNKDSFNERPYYRIFSTLLSEWSDIRCKFPIMADGAEKTALLAFDRKFYLVLADFFTIYQPLAYPGFTFAWLTLISHRMFLPNILEIPEKCGWKKLCSLIVCVLRFISKNMDGENITKIIGIVDKGLIHIFELIQQDYPEFFIEYHYVFSYTIPSVLFQLRNIVLSSFPKKMVLSDPFNTDVRIESIEECSSAPLIAINPGNDLLKVGLKKPVDNYIRIPHNSIFKSILSGMKTPDIDDNGEDVNVKLINALILYATISATESSRLDFNPQASEVTLITSLLQDSCVELQYSVITAIVNQLRYPSSHTKWASLLIKHLFENKNLKQLITRVLLERVVASRPHPWGVVYTFVHLLTSENFTDFDFVKQTPELSGIFTAFAKHVSAN